MQAHGLQPWQFHLQQPLSQGRAHQQGYRPLVQGQGHQQTEEPAGVAAGGQAHGGLIGAAQAAGHQTAEGEVMRPARLPLLAEERLQLLVGLGFQHPRIVGSWIQTTVQQ
jgi:hypothetical protein